MPPRAAPAACLLVLLATTLGLSAQARAAETDLPFDDHPRTLHADNLDRFYIDFGSKMIRWTTSADKVFNWHPPKDWSTNSIQHAVAPTDGTIHTIQEVSHSKCTDKECKNRVTDYRINKWTCKPDGDCKSDQIASWSRRSGEKSGVTHSASLRVTEKGTPLLSHTTRRWSEKKSETTVEYRCGKKSCKVDEFTEAYFSEMLVPPRHRINEQNHTISGPGLPASHSIGAVRLLETMAAVDFRHIYDRKGRPHVYLHQSSGRRFGHRYVDETTGTALPMESAIDEPESGASNAAARLGEAGMLTLHYFYRNSYYKGVKATWFPDANGSPAWSIDIDNARDQNPGWQLEAAATPQGRIMVGYLRDPKGKAGYRLRLFDGIQDVKNAEQKGPEGWEKKHKAWSGLVGLGGTRASWMLSSGMPSDEDFEGVENADIYKIESEYQVAPSYLAELAFEARLGRFSLGASYARQLLEAAAGDLGMSGRQTEQLFGMIGIDRIIKYHDIRVQLRQGRMSTDYSLSPQDTENSPIQEISDHLDCRYSRTDVYLLNTWRVRYGIFRQSYQAVLPFYAWYIEEGSTDSYFVGSFISPATMSDTGITIGYSRLDYASKFENNVNTLYLDGDVGLGLSIAEFDAPVQVGDESVDQATAFMLPFNAELGFLLLRRSYNLRGVGFFARAGYRAEGNVAGTSGKPPEKEEAAESSKLSVGFDRMELRHGPALLAGFVF